MHGLFLVWLVSERGFSPALVATILAAGELAIFAFEVPTGWAADRLGHRASLIMGSLLQVCGMLAFWLASTPGSVLTATLLVALGDAFRSGADEALVYRTCVALGREDEFQAIEARTRAGGLVALVALLLAGGAIVSRFGYDAAWLAEVTLSVVGGIIACLMVEPPGRAGSSILAADETVFENRTVPAPGAAAEGPRWTTAAPFARTFVSLVFPAAVLGAMANAAAFLAQTTAQSEAAGVTLLVAAITLVEAAGAALAGRVPWRGPRVHAMLTVTGVAVSAVSILAVSCDVPGGLTFAAVGLAFLVGVIDPLRAAALQAAAADGVRARVASLASACDMACNTLSLLVAGAWRSRARRG
jgi:MFS family permease